MIRWFRNEQRPEKRVRVPDVRLTDLSTSIVERILISLVVKDTTSLKCASTAHNKLVSSVETNEYWHRKLSLYTCCDIRLDSLNWKGIYHSITNIKLIASFLNPVVVDRETSRAYAYIMARVLDTAGIDRLMYNAIVAKRADMVRIIADHRGLIHTYSKCISTAIAMSNSEVVKAVLDNTPPGSECLLKYIVSLAVNRGTIDILDTVATHHSCVMADTTGKWTREWTTDMMSMVVKTTSVDVMTYVLRRVNTSDAELTSIVLLKACTWLVYMGDKVRESSKLIRIILGSTTKCVCIADAACHVITNKRHDLVLLMLGYPNITVSSKNNTLAHTICTMGDTSTVLSVLDHHSFNPLVGSNNHIVAALHEKHVLTALAVIRHPKTQIKAFGNSVLIYCIDNQLYTVARTILLHPEYMST